MFSFCDGRDRGVLFQGKKKNVLVVIEATFFVSLLEMYSFTVVTTYCIK